MAILCVGPKQNAKHKLHTKKLNTTDNNNVEPSTNIVIPYTQGLCESIQNVCTKYGIHTHFNSSKTLKNMPIISKKKDKSKQKSGFIC